MLGQGHTEPAGDVDTESHLAVQEHLSGLRLRRFHQDRLALFCRHALLSLSRNARWKNRFRSTPHIRLHSLLFSNHFAVSFSIQASTQSNLST